MKISISRTKKDSVVSVAVEIAKNKNLSLQAKGLMLVLLSLQDGEDFDIKESEYFSNGKFSAVNTLNELKRAGYAKSVQKRINGSFGDVTLFISDSGDFN